MFYFLLRYKSFLFILNNSCFSLRLSSSEKSNNSSCVSSKNVAERVRKSLFLNSMVAVTCLIHLNWFHRLKKVYQIDIHTYLFLVGWDVLVEVRKTTVKVLCQISNGWVWFSGEFKGISYCFRVSLLFILNISVIKVRIK